RGAAARRPSGRPPPPAADRAGRARRALRQCRPRCRSCAYFLPAGLAGQSAAPSQSVHDRNKPLSTVAMTPRVFLFAPSPNGELHLGHACSALLNQRLARETGGRLLLRIEDIDVTRCTPEFEAGIYRDLEWLGLDWEKTVRRQSEHFDDYSAALETL